MTYIENEIIYTKSNNEMIVGTNNGSYHNALNNVSKVCVILPTHVEGIPVRVICSNAFSRSTSLTTLHISRTIREIKRDAIAYIKTLIEISFDPQSELTTIGQGFLHDTGVKNVFIPPRVSSIGAYFLGITHIEDFSYCNKREASYSKMFTGNDVLWEPKRIHVLRSYRYENVGSYSTLLKDGFCERMLATQTHGQCNHMSRYTRCFLLIMIL